jgi:peptidoglycan/xylan/chitin deacetylase (PgdA/CDA1 family)
MVSEIACLMYHEVTDDPATSGFQRPAARAYTLSAEVFARHVDAIARGSLTPELIGDVELSRPGRHLLLTFDDGGKSALYTAEQLERRGWKGHFFIVTGLIGKRTFLSVADIRALRDRGHVVGSHSHTHPDIFRGLTHERMLVEWRTSCDMLSDLLGEPCIAGSVPGGDISRAVFASAQEAGLRYLFTSEPWPHPARVGDTWVLGRVCLKADVSPGTIAELVQFRGWQRAQFVRGMGRIARALCPPLYEHYVRLRTREEAS